MGPVRTPLPNHKYVPKPYEKMQCPGQRVQVDVKFVPKVCHVGEAKGKQFYQYTAIDEYSRFRYVEAFEEHSTYSSTIFLVHMLRFFKFQVECVQTAVPQHLLFSEYALQRKHENIDIKRFNCEYHGTKTYQLRQHQA